MDKNHNSPTNNPNISLRYEKISNNAYAPTRGSKYSAGYDLYSATAMTIPPKERAIVPTDIRIAVPKGTYGRIAPRSGLATKFFIDVGAGVIDYDYRGTVDVVLFNFGDKDFEIDKGDRIAQLILEKIEYCDAVEAKTLDFTDRGNGGFGSTGIKPNNHVEN